MNAVRLAISILACGGMLTNIGVVHSQNYPAKPVRIITGGPTGASGLSSRFIAQGISSPLGQPVVADYRGSGAIPGDIVAKSPPDGYTLVVSGSSLWVGPLLQSMPYDPVKDLAPITTVGLTPLIVVVHPSLPVRSVKELIALAKAHPGQLNYSTGGLGGTDHLGFEFFKSLAGINIVVVPYANDSQQLTDLLRGEMQMTFGTPASFLEQVKLGKLRALAVTSAERSAIVPDLPTVASAGLPGFDTVLSVVMLAPAKTPEPIIHRLNEEVVRYIKTPDAKELFLKSGIEVVGSSPEQLAATMKSEMTRWSKVITDAKIKVK